MSWSWYERSSGKKRRDMPVNLINITTVYLSSHKSTCPKTVLKLREGTMMKSHLKDGVRGPEMTVILEKISSYYFLSPF